MTLKEAMSARHTVRKVSMTCPDVSFAGADLGISKYHFELGAGKENFTWK